jgi:hypothetical protein
VTPTPDRDRAVEGLLRARRAQPVEPATAVCPDASQLAAWADGSLSAREAEQLEAHLTTCAHCEAVLAAFANTAPPVPPPFWRRWAVLVPLAAAAAAAAVWLVVAPGQHVNVVPVPTVARLEAPGLPAGPAPAPTPERREVARPGAPTPAPKESRRSTPAGTRPSGLTAGDLTADKVDATRAKVASDRAAQPNPPPAPAAPPPNFQAAQPRPPSVPPMPAPPPPPPAATVVAESPLIDTKKTATLAEFTSPVFEFDSAAVVTGGGDASSQGLAGGGGGRGARAGRGGAGGAAAAQAVPATPAGPTRWRILTSGAVERSVGDGSPWSPVAIDPAVRLTSGVAPSPTTCWLVGRAGAVLVSKDAVHFVRMDIPQPLDLVSVTASAIAVTVTAADGSTFTTLDGGLTWRKPTA